MSEFDFFTEEEEEEEEEENTNFRTRAQEMTDDFFKLYYDPLTFSDKDRAYAREYMKHIIERQMDYEYINGISDIPPRQLNVRCPSPFVFDFVWLMMVMAASSFSSFTAMSFAASRGNSYFDPLLYVICFLSGIFYIGIPMCLWDIYSPVKRMPERTRTRLSVLIIIATYIVSLIICFIFNRTYTY